MLPKFPEFKKLELSDREEIEKMTLIFEPYSDFDFASMWSWDTENDLRVSNINGNLVAILADHFTGQAFYSFLGNNQVTKTLKQIFAFSLITDNFIPILRAVPEVSLDKIDLKKFIIEIDLNNCDYVYSTKELASYDGSKFGGKRKLAGRFSRNNPTAKIQVLNASNPDVKSMVLELTKSWEKNKTDKEGLNLSKEYIAIQRFLDADFDHVYNIGLFVESKLIGYQLCTIATHNYAICHFGKIDVNFQGAFEFMMNATAASLLENNVEMLNTEEDLGLLPLRHTKNSYRPIKVLRKYTIREI